jgi:ASC-1-like (ASCH) protein
VRNHKLKLRHEFWDAVMDGSKCFEIRNNDRGFQKGDTVRFIYVDELGVETYKKSKETFEITYVLSHEWIKHGYVVFGIAPTSKESGE